MTIRALALGYCLFNDMSNMEEDYSDTGDSHICLLFSLIRQYPNLNPSIFHFHWESYIFYLKIQMLNRPIERCPYSGHFIAFRDQEIPLRKGKDVSRIFEQIKESGRRETKQKPQKNQPKSSPSPKNKLWYTYSRTILRSVHAKLQEFPLGHCQHIITRPTNHLFEQNDNFILKKSKLIYKRTRIENFIGP